MNKIMTIIKREYKEAVFKKSFIIMTLITPILMIALTLGPSLLMMQDVEETTIVRFMDSSGFIYAELEESLQDTLSNGQPRYILSQRSAENDFETVLAEEKENIISDKVDVLVVIPANVVDSLRFEFYAKKVGNIDLNKQIRHSINTIIHDYKLQASALDPELIQELMKPVQMKTVKLRKGGIEKEGGFFQEYMGTFLFVMILYMTLLIYGNSVMRSIVQEKNSRVIEVLLSGSNPFQLLTGKILGGGSVGLTQYIIWAVFGLLLSLYGGSMMPNASEFITFTPQVLFYFVVFYILGYFLFSVLYASIGSIANTDQEAQQMSMPVVIFLIIPIVVFSYIVKSPDSTIAMVLSQIPFFSPILMFARINLSTPALWEIWLSIALLIVFIILFIWLSAKIFRTGILMYGKRPTFPEIVKWIGYK